MTDKKQLNIIHFYPDLLNLYGDKGNISALKMRLKWRGIGCNITTVRSADQTLPSFTVPKPTLVYQTKASPCESRGGGVRSTSEGIDPYATPTNQNLPLFTDPKPTLVSQGEVSDESLTEGIDPHATPTDQTLPLFTDPKPTLVYQTKASPCESRGGGVRSTSEGIDPYATPTDQTLPSFTDPKPPLVYQTKASPCESRGGGVRSTSEGIDLHVTLSTAEGSHIGDKPDDFNLSDADIVFLGGGLDKEQRLVSEALLKHKDDFIRYVEDGGVILAVCGGYQMLGKYYMAEGEKVEGLGLLDIYSEAKKDRIIGNVVLETELFSQKIVGFENHSAITYIGEGKPLGKVLCGGGNTGDGGYEGIIYKNIIGTNLHGPLLPKNPMLCDYILSAAMARKYNDFTGLKPLNDEVEAAANEYIVNRFTT